MQEGYVSIIICTYNRSRLLSETLLSMAKQVSSSTHFEVIVVDNNSIDDTRDIVESKVPNYPTSLSYVYESRQGLSFARNTGIKHAKGEIIVFTDDDVEAEAGWLDAIVAAFDNDDVVCAGGPIRPIWPLEKPEWLSENWQVYLGVYEYADAVESRELHGPCYPCGVNIAFRKSVFSEVGMFSTDLGRIGTSLLSNEESRVCNLIERAGKKIGFAPQAIIYHKISSARLTKQWFYHRLYWQGRSDAIMDKSLGNDCINKVVNYLTLLLSGHNVSDGLTFDRRCSEKLIKGYIIQFFIMADSGNATDIFKVMQRTIGRVSNNRRPILPVHNANNVESPLCDEIDPGNYAINSKKLQSIYQNLIEKLKKTLSINV